MFHLHVKYFCPIFFHPLIRNGFITLSDQVDGFTDPTLLARQLPELPFPATAKLPRAGPFSPQKKILMTIWTFRTCLNLLRSTCHASRFENLGILCRSTTFAIKVGTALQTKHKTDGWGWYFPSVSLVFCSQICTNFYREYREPTSPAAHFIMPATWT